MDRCVTSLSVASLKVANLNVAMPIMYLDSLRQSISRALRVYKQIVSIKMPLICTSGSPDDPPLARLRRRFLAVPL